jgi:ABC-type branched-subunit amino acid transport system substrate-binding protein
VQKMFPDETKNAGILWGDYAVIKDRKDQITEAFTASGWEFKSDCSLSYNIAGESDWKPFVQKLKDCGAQTVYFVGSPYPHFENVLDAAKQIGYDPIWYVDPNFYDESFRKWNKDGLADKVYMRQAYLPFEEADHSEATQQYLDIVKANGGDPNQLGAQAASAFLLWATATKACGSDVTRACVEQQLSNIHDWTGGGLHGSADPGNNEPSECGMLLGMKGTSYVRVSPAETGTFTCDQANVYSINPTSDLLIRNNIGADRIARL